MDFDSILLAKAINGGGGGGGSAVLIDKNISSNGTYNASTDNADGYKKVVVSVPNTYVAGDEGKVVSNGALVSQTSATYDSNGTYDTTLKNSVTVNVSGSSEPVIGLLTTVEITEAVATISYELPQLAKEYGQLWEVWENVTYSNDYLYAGVVPNGFNLGDNYGYKNQATSHTGVSQQFFQFAQTFEGTSLNGFCACIRIGNKTNISTIYTSDKTYYFKAKLYNSASRFTGGKIKIYGRVQ